MHQLFGARVDERRVVPAAKAASPIGRMGDGKAVFDNDWRHVGGTLDCAGGALQTWTWRDLLRMPKGKRDRDLVVPGRAFQALRLVVQRYEAK